MPPMPRRDGPLRLCLFGAAPDTHNLGVSALFLSTMAAILARAPDAEVSVFDHGRGVRRDQVTIAGATHAYTRIGANHSRRYYRRDSLLNMRLSAALGGIGNPGVRAIAEADAVLDISGGDSFADLYGRKRFEAITQPKLLTLKLGAPLVLLPQTYGPFDAPDTRAVAEDIVRRARMAWARDRRSFENLRDLLGDAFDPARHACGVDVAFALPTAEPSGVPAWLLAWQRARADVPLVGVNVSGLILNQGERATARFGFKEPYRDLVMGLLRKVLAESDARVVLVPHVLARPGHPESDPQACAEIARALDAPDRVAVLEAGYNAMEMKWVIARTSFFVGTRMHATIAGLSSGVPTAAVAYSRKTQGVFESCGQGSWVADPRAFSAAACVDRIWQAWEAREAIRTSLETALPPVRQQAQAQQDRIFALLDANGTDDARAA